MSATAEKFGVDCIVLRVESPPDLVEVVLSLDDAQQVVGVLSAACDGGSALVRSEAVWPDGYTLTLRHEKWMERREVLRLFMAKLKHLGGWRADDQRFGPNPPTPVFRIGIES